MKAVYAEAKNGIIGKDGTLPWHLPHDLAFFKAETMGTTMIMGRKTFDGMNQRVLPGRQTLILTRDNHYKAPAAVNVCHSIEEAVQKTKYKPTTVIGGAEIFHLFLPYIDEIKRTVVHAEVEGDTRMPDDFLNNFECIEQKYHPKDAHNIYDITFETWKRKNVNN